MSATVAALRGLIAQKRAAAAEHAQEADLYREKADEALALQRAEVETADELEILIEAAEGLLPAPAEPREATE